MLYILGSKTNSFDLINFDHESSSDFTIFREGVSLNPSEVFLSYTVESKSAATKIQKIPYIESTGPSLVSKKLRTLLSEEEKNGEVEFFDAIITCGNERIEEFYAINPLNKMACTNMRLSEFNITNFDPNNPQYSFDYQVLHENFDTDINIALCQEMPSEVIINDKLLERIKKSSIKGLLLYSALDMTMEDRSVFVKT